MALVENTRVSFGKNYTPSGEEYTGIKVTIGNVFDPSTQKRTYSDIEAILGRNKADYEVHEERTSYSTFKSYSVFTG